MIIDTHVHLIGHREENHCYVHPRMFGGITYRFLVHVLGLGGTGLDDLDKAYLDKLIAWVEQSDLDAAGLLAMDGVYDHRGELDRNCTNVLVGNDYCFEACRLSKKLLPICSINPQRKDALEELDRVAEMEAVAIKTIPNSQAFDPIESRYKTFWKRMADHGLPLLSHTSFEHTIPVYDQTLGRPEKLRPALECGVTVIAAHCSTAGIVHLHEDLGPWLSMLEDHPNLYGDISALASVARFPYIRKILSHERARDRILLGSDFPVPVSPLLFLPRLGFSTVRKLKRIKNPLQRNLATFQALGVDETALRRASKVLRLSKRE